MERAAPVIRPATRPDLPALGRLGAGLLRVHHALDPQRFMRPGGDPERGYAWFLGTQLERPRVLLLVAEADGRAVGYVYAAVEPLDWMELREEAGFIHDLAVEPALRGRGIGRRLVDAALEWLRGEGMPRAIIWTAVGNRDAETLFQRSGFRPTMVEMTKELAPSDR